MCIIMPSHQFSSNSTAELPNAVLEKAVRELRGLYVDPIEPAVFSVLTKFRERCKSGAELGRRVGFHPNTVYDWLHKRKKCSLEAFIKCCDESGIDYIKLLKNGLLVHGQNKSKTRLPLTLIPKMFWFYGVVATDGYHGKARGGRVQIAVTQKDHQFLAEVKRVCIGNFGVAISGPYLNKERGECRIASRSRILSEILRVFGSVPFGRKSGRGSPSPKLPCGIDGLPPEYLGAYLAGVIEGDGCVVRRDWYICSYHRSFLEELAGLLQTKLSIITTLGRKTRGNEFDLYFPASERKKVFHWIYPYLSHHKKIRDVLRTVGD
jgi:hypothetical protein